MDLHTLNKDIIDLKNEIKKMEAWINQTSTIVYELEQNIMDMQDIVLYEKYEEKSNMTFFKKVQQPINLVRQDLKMIAAAKTI